MSLEECYQQQNRATKTDQPADCTQLYNRIVEAEAHLSKLCETGGRSWSLSIPVKQYDSDMVYGDMICYAKNLLCHLRSPMTHVLHATNEKCRDDNGLRKDGGEGVLHRQHEREAQQPVGVSIETIKNFASDPKVHDAVRNTADPFSVAWHKREDEHSRALESATKRESAHPVGLPLAKARAWPGVSRVELLQIATNAFCRYNPPGYGWDSRALEAACKAYLKAAIPEQPVDTSDIAHKLEYAFPQISLSALSDIIEYFRPYLRAPEREVSRDKYGVRQNKDTGEWVVFYTSDGDTYELCTEKEAADELARHLNDIEGGE